VVAATPFTYSQVMISSGKNVSGAILRGIDLDTAPEVINLRKNLVRGNLEDLRSSTSEGTSVSDRTIDFGSGAGQKFGSAPGRMGDSHLSHGTAHPYGTESQEQAFPCGGDL